jgi:hypothetical protein
MILIAIALIAAPKPESAHRRTVTPEEFKAAEPARKIVMIDVKGWVDDDDKRVEQARTVLDRLVKKFDANPHEMVRDVELFWRYLNEAEVESTATQFLEAASAWTGGRDFSKPVVVYAELRKGGMDHESAVKALKRKR